MTFTIRFPGIRKLALVLATASRLVFGQNPDLLAGKKVFSERCAVCHGNEAQGTNRGPALAGNRRLRTLSAPQLQRLIQNGVPAAGMPGFDLPAAEFSRLVAFLGLLNFPAAESPLPGNEAAGERFFFAAGHCNSCHMVRG